MTDRGPRLESDAPDAVWTGCPVRVWARRTPDAAALVTPERVWRYADLDRRVDAVAARLRAEGVSLGTRVGVWMPRTPEAVAWLWALWRVGAVAAPLNRRLPPGRVPEALRRAGCTVLVTAPDPARNPAPDPAPGSAPDPAPDAVADTVADAVERACPSVHRMRSDDPAPAAEPDVSARRASQEANREASRDATLVFTSGSTGTPKAALHTWRNHVASADGSNVNLPLNAGDRWLLSLPLYHVGGLAILFRCALAGAAAALPDPSASLADAVDALRPTHLSLVSTQLRRLLAASPTPPASLRVVLCGGSAIPAALLDDAHAGGWPVHTTYGCTEMASQVTTTAPGASRDDLRTAGRTLPHRELRIDTPDRTASSGDAPGDGAVGEICVRGATLFRGYVDGANGDALRDPRDADGWYRTGDVGRIDAAGRLRVVGRVDRMFVSGGENVQPEEIEAALQRIDGVVEAVVVAVPDATYGQRPVAFVRICEAPGAAHESPDAPRATDPRATDPRALPPSRADALERQLRDALPGYKVPDAFYALPSDATGGGLKTDREALTRWARNLHT